MRQELIGLEVEVARCTDPTMEGLKGKIVDETKNTFVILLKDKQKRVRVPKISSLFRFLIEGKEYTIDGKEIMFRPEDRIKKIR